jgi:hypothetical protein
LKGLNKPIGKSGTGTTRDRMEGLDIYIQQRYFIDTERVQLIWDKTTKYIFYLNHNQSIVTNEKFKYFSVYNYLRVVKGGEMEYLVDFQDGDEKIPNVWKRVIK